MKPIQEIIAERPWAKFIKGNLVHDDVLGYTTQAEIDEALACGAIVKRDGKSWVPAMTIQAKENAPGRAGDRKYNTGDTIYVVSTRYTDFINGRESKASARRYHEEATTAMLGGIPDHQIDLSDIPDFK